MRMAATIGDREAVIAKNNPMKLYVMEKARQIFNTILACFETAKK
jgi:hypothetical protein